MSLPNDIAAELPPSRDDEPASLRQDIVDELADHLHCALQRELLTGRGRGTVEDAGAAERSGPGQSSRPLPPAPVSTDVREAEAWQQVITRFGYPATVARQLWIDAMKDKLMAQKLTATMATLAAVACILMCVLVWRSISRDSAAQSELLQQQQELNASLLREFKAMQASTSMAATNAGWAPMTISLEDDAGDPVGGSVRIDGTAINAGNDNKIDVFRQADASGTADFGLLPFGNYDLLVDLSETSESHHESLMLSPGTPSQRTIVCPSSRPPVVDARFILEPPMILDRKGIVYVILFERLPRLTTSGQWSLSEAERYFRVVVAADGHLLGEVTDSAAILNDRPAPSGRSMGGFGSTRRAEPTATRLQIAPVTSLRAEEYRLQSVSVAARLGRSSTSGDELWVYEAPVGYVPTEAESPELSPSVTFVADDENRFELEPSEEFWDMTIRRFRAFDDAAVSQVALPAGWQIVAVPADVRKLMSITNVGELFSRSSSNAENAQFEEDMCVDVRVDIKSNDGSEPAPNSELPVLVAAAGVVSVPTTDEIRDLFSRGRGSTSVQNRLRQMDIKVIVSDEMAAAINLARERTTVDATFNDACNDTGPTLNAETLALLESLPVDNRRNAE